MDSKEEDLEKLEDQFAEKLAYILLNQSGYLDDSKAKITENDKQDINLLDKLS